MDDEKRRELGVAKRRQILGAAHVDKAMAAATAESREFQDLLNRFVWGEIWTRDGLDERTRRVLVIGTLIAIGRWDELALHARAAVTEGGFTRQDLLEIVLQQAVYCGIPTARHALGVVQEAVGGSDVR